MIRQSPHAVARRLRAAETARVALLIAIAACSDQPASPRNPPAILSVAVEANLNNSLSAVVRFTSRDGDSARVLYRKAEQVLGSPRYPLMTPYYPISGDSGTVVVLGLRPDAQIELVVEVRSALSATSTSFVYRSGALPPALVGLHLDASSLPIPGFTLTDFTGGGSAFLVAFDQAGDVTWYREFAAAAGEAALDAEQQPNGNFTLFVGASTGWQAASGKFYEVTPAGQIVRTYATNSTYYTDPHELLLNFSGGLVSQVNLLGYDLRRMDLTSFGGRPEQLVAGHVLVRQSPSGAVEFLWNAWDHFTLEDWIFIPPNIRQMPSIDFDHPNSIATDAQGNYIVSFASLGVIAKIDGRTGDVLWRLGGKRNDFTFLGDPLGGFGIQHDARLLPNGDILFFDNGTGHSPPESRAVEYRIDPVNRTATMVWEYRHEPAVFAPFAGSVQRLGNGNTVVSFGAKPNVVEVAQNGSVVWEGEVTQNGRPVTFFYRTVRIGSLYSSDGGTTSSSIAASQ
ncbi:MAG: arylsulfotransferase family protein [Gemmatimonadaceae bacterium]